MPASSRWRHARRRARLALLAALAVAPAAEAVTFERFDVDVRDGEFYNFAQVLVDAPRSAVYRVATDYAGYQRLNDGVRESRVLAPDAAGHARRRIVFETCILFFCRTMRMEEVITRLPTGDLYLRIDPAASDFSSGWSRWEFVAVAPGTTRITYTATRRPAFWIPPLASRWIIRHQLRREIEETMMRIEHIARDEKL